MKVTYLLYRKGGVGALAKMGGVKLSDGCVLVPNSVSDEIIGMLSSLGVEAKKLEIYVSADSLKAWLSHKPTITLKESSTVA